MAKKLRPLHDRVLIRRIGSEERSAGGILIPDTVREKPVTGEVIAVGAGVRHENGTVTPLSVKAGEYVMFGKYSGMDVKINGEELVIMKEADILGIVDIKGAGKKVA